MYWATEATALVFQFALPRGERREGASCPPPQRGFQFALPRGERPWARYPSATVSKFQFALPRGERHIEYHMMRWRRWFQFALPRGERRWWRQSATSRGRFQFALPRGERPRDCGKCHRITCFNSRSRVGSDKMTLIGVRPSGVSIRAPAWGATIQPPWG